MEPDRLINDRPSLPGHQKLPCAAIISSCAVVQQGHLVESGILMHSDRSSWQTRFGF